MLIAGLNKTTLLDFPGRVATTIFTGGCNFKCPFCHNGGLVLDPFSLEIHSEAEILDFLEKRKKVHKGVCITGGEPMLQADLPEFIGKIKELGYQVKLDTNGYLPDVLRQLLEAELLDYVAMDIKNCREKYAMTVGMEERQAVSFPIERIEESVALLKKGKVPYEFRTTVVKEFHTLEDMQRIGEWIAGCPQYFLQQFQENENMIRIMTHPEEEETPFHGYTGQEMIGIARALQQIPELRGRVFLRGIE